MIARVGWGLSSSRAIVLVAFVLGLLLRCFGVDAHELQYDEAATRYFSTLPWPDLWGAPALLEPNPPLFYSLAWLITHAGGSPEQIRYISVIAGSLCVPMAWLIAGRTAGAARDLAGASAALLVATSPQNIAMSQYARAYALLILCVMCAFFCILQARRLAFAPTPPERAWNPWWWSGYVVAAVAALYTHHTAVLILAALNMAILLGSVHGGFARWNFLGDFLVANSLVAAFYAPWLPVLITQSIPPEGMAPPRFIHATGLLERLSGAISDPFAFNKLPWIDVWLLPPVLLGAWRSRSSSDMVALAAFVLGGVGLMFLASQFHPLLDGKTLAWAGLLAVLVAGIGCGTAGRFCLPLLIAAIFLELRSVPTAVEPTPEGWREVAQIFRDMARPGDAVYINYAGAVLPLRQYGWPEAQLDIKVYATSDKEPWFRGRLWPIVDPTEIADDAVRLGRVWLVAYGETRQSDGIDNEIGANSVRVLHRRTAKLDVSLFDRHSP